MHSCTVQWVFGLLNGLDITGSHLLDTQLLDSSVGELRSDMFTEIPGPSTLDSYNVHNVLAGSNIFIWVCFARLAVFLNPKSK